MTRRAVLRAALAASAFALLPAALLAVPLPLTPAQPLVEIIHGRRVPDPYRWLENAADPKVRAWSNAQSARARAALDGLPAVARLRQELKLLLDGSSPAGRVFYTTGRGSRLFVLRQPAGKQQPLLTREDAAGGAAFTIYDPLKVESHGPTKSIDWFVPSPDGARVAVSISEGGSERGTLHIFDAQDGRLIEPPIANVYNATAGGDLAWLPDASGFFYTRYPRPEETPAAEQGFFQKLYSHRIGTAPSEDRLELGSDFGRVAEIRLEVSETGRLLAIVQDGDSGRFAIYLRERDAAWKQVSHFKEAHFHALFGDDDDIFVLSYRAGGRGEVLRLKAGEPLSRATTIVPQLDGSALAHSFYSHTNPAALWTGDRLHLVYQTGGPTRLRVFDREGKEYPAPAQPAVGSISSLARGSGDSLLFAVETFTSDTRWYTFGGGRTFPAPNLNPAALDEWSDVDVRREEAVSPDGTKVPLTILRGPGAAERNAPAVITAYGGFASSMRPRFEKSWRALLARGVIIVVANIRGGSEFGRDWHRQAILVNRQRAFDDFRAVVSHVQAKGYTTPARTAIMGSSNGGLLMGVAITQFPELVRAVVADVGLFDMVRAERDPNGLFNIPEYGAVADSTEFAALLAYSPYHNVRSGRRYPAVLFTTGANDMRVNPMHSRKMAAALQAAAGPGTPILLRADEGVGHGSGTSLALQIEDKSDAYGFLLARIAG